MKQCNAQPSQKAQVELRAGKIHATLFNQKNPLLNFDTILLEQLEYKKDIHIQGKSRDLIFMFKSPVSWAQAGKASRFEERS